MDGQRFDSFARALAGRQSRRLLLWRGAVAGGAVGSLALLDSASAARRGTTANTSICAPNSWGGYTRTSVPTVLLSTYLNTGSIISDCCSDDECGPSNGCMTSTCDLNAGVCSVSYANGSPCERPGCADGYCSAGVCMDPTPMYCAGDGFCNTCVYDACHHHCSCDVHVCYPDDWQCQHVRCDAGQAACVWDPINDGEPCDTFGVAGVCTNGYCISE